MPSSLPRGHARPRQVAPGGLPITLVSNFIVSMTDFLARYSIFSQPQSTWPKSFRTDDEDLSSIRCTTSWINALVSPEPVMDDDNEQPASLQHQIREWRKPISGLDHLPSASGLRSKNRLSARRTRAIPVRPLLPAVHQPAGGAHPGRPRVESDLWPS
ncbi:MAG: hypothetical protein U1F77_15335 [Kiritimatiellia bacterium]